MEQFLDDIYKDAYIIEELRETIDLIQQGCFTESRALYNNIATKLEHIIAKIAPENPQMATIIQNAAVKVMNDWSDGHLAVNAIENELIPSFLKYLSFFTDIEVEDRGYLIKSSSTGFLTLKDLDRNHFMHDVFDPMWEAHKMAEHLYKPEMECFLIFGADLGYLAYQLWIMSRKAMKIYIYECSANLVQYALNYGVLSWIDKDCLEIVSEPEAGKLVERYLNDATRFASISGRYIPLWLGEKYSHECNGRLTHVSLSDSTDRRITDLSIVNIWKNLKYQNIPFSTIKKMYQKKEWIVIAAGPSLDECIVFIHKNEGRIGIIAVSTVLKRLKDEGIIPDLVIAIDPSPEMSKHIEGIESYTKDIPLIALILLSWEFADKYQGPKCFMISPAAVRIYPRCQNINPTWDISGTVSNMAIETAIQLGAQRIHLVGLDLAYPDGFNYAHGMAHERTQKTDITMSVASVDGGTVGTNEVFDIFRKAIEKQVARHKNIQFINHSSHGAVISGTINMTDTPDC